MSIDKPINESIIGIDVAKDKLDLYFSYDNSYAIYENTDKGLKQLIKVLNKSNFDGMMILEATGGYERLSHTLLTDAGFKVHIAHPKRVHHFILQKGYYGKTDKSDAKALAEFGLQESVCATPSKDKIQSEQQDLAARRTQLLSMLTAEKCRLKEHLSLSTKQSIKRSIKILEKEMNKIELKLNKNIEADKDAYEKFNLLMTYKCVGPITAMILLCALPELGSLNRKEVACLCGLAPRNRDSGKKKGKRVTYGGRGDVRKALYMAALSGIKYNPILKAFYEKLKQAGKPAKVCLTAVMRKVIITLNAMLRDKKEWVCSTN